MARFGQVQSIDVGRIILFFKAGGFFTASSWPMNDLMVFSIPNVNDLVPACGKVFTRDEKRSVFSR